MWSPRIGVAFPITDQGILHFSYGHFFQMPTMRNLFLTSIFGAGLAPSIGYGDLKPQKTVMYEFGLQQQLSHFIAINGSLFFKDIRDLLALQSISYVSPTYGPSSYAVYLNKDYSMVQGITLSLTKRRDPKTRLSAFLDYSYQTTEGNSVTSGSFYFNALTGVEEEKKIESEKMTNQKQEEPKVLGTIDISVKKPAITEKEKNTFRLCVTWIKLKNI